MVRSKMLFFCSLSFYSVILYGQQVEDTTTQIVTPTKKYSYLKSLLFGNVDRTFDRPFDATFFVAPSYSNEGSFGLGAMASGLYRLDRKDSIMPPSDITLTLNISLKLFFALIAQGNNYFKDEKSLLSYQIGLIRKPLNFWGISYDACDKNPYTKHTRQQFKIYANYRYKIIPHFYLSGVFDFLYAGTQKIDSIEYLQNQKLTYIHTGLGVSVQYDTRDFIPNPQKGFYIMFRQSYFPQILGNAEKPLYRTTLIFNTYQKLWKQCILAVDLFGEFNNKNAPWSMREMLGDDFRMRGYYNGRYTDNNIATAQIELRQYIISRFGAVAWVGGGTVFPSLGQFKFQNILLNYGIGLRFEIKHNTNIRIDYGFGRKTGGFVLAIGEAF